MSELTQELTAGLSQLLAADWQLFRQLPMNGPAAGQRSLRQSQLNKLTDYIRSNQDTDFGRENDYKSLLLSASQEDLLTNWQSAVPMQYWETLRPHVEEICQGRNGVLSAEDVLCLIPTAGSKGTRKLIPWTASLRQEFLAALAPWYYDLLQAFPAIRHGRCYWSALAPASGDERTRGDLPIGCPSLSDYYGAEAGALLSQLLIFPVKARASVPDSGSSTNNSFAQTLQALVAADDLSLVSVSDPSWLEAILTWKTPGEEAEGLLSVKRLSELHEAQKHKDLTALWSQLSVISCRADEAAASSAGRLRRFFPGVYIQPQGLVTTEASISLPWCEEPGEPLLAWRSHFFEFIPISRDTYGHELLDTNPPLLADQLKTGQVYEVVVTTGNGFARYRLGDRVQVSTHLGALPRLHFVGSEGQLVNLCGERLTAAWVRDCFRDLNWLDTYPEPGVLFLAPAADGRHYTLFASSDWLAARLHAEPEMMRQLDRALRRSPAYDDCRRQSRLAPADVFAITGNAYQAWLTIMMRDGLRLSEIKPFDLSMRTDWQQRLPGSLWQARS